MKNVRLNDTTYEGISKVQLPTANGGTASFKDEDEIVDPVLKTDVEITPTTSDQEIDVPEGFDGFDAFTVKGVTAAIDSNIVAGNIKKNVEILGVTGTLDTGSDPVLKTDLVITPATEPQNIPVPSGYDGFGALEVDAVTAAIDANIVAEKIKKNVTILGVTGSYEGETPAPKTPTIQVAQTGLITVSGDGIVTTTHQLSEEDDPAFTSANIAKNSTIFGKDGAHEGGGGTTPVQDLGEFAADSSVNQYGSITVPYRGKGVYCVKCTEVISPTTLSSTARLALMFIRDNYSSSGGEVVNGAAFTAGQSTGFTNLTGVVEGSTVTINGTSTGRLASKTYHVWFIPAADFGGF